MLIRNPFVWLRRLPHSRGHGIHSPFAYALTTQVLYSPGRYYADEWLPRLLPWHVRLLRLRPLAVHRLLFRLANHWQPRLVACPDGLTPAEWNYLHEGCRHATIDPGMPGGVADLLLVRRPRPVADLLAHVGEDSLLVVADLPRNRPLWRQLLADPRTRVTFDLCDLGLVVFTSRLQREDYVINW